MMNRAVLAAMSSVVVAQLMKIDRSESTRLGIDSILHSGGMPSSHSAGVTSLATYIGLKKGWSSISFAIAAMLGLIVMYDASGARRHAGETALHVNDLDVDVENLAGEHPGVYHMRRAQKLKENLGHQPIEVAAGALLGMGVGAVTYYMSQRD